MSAKKPETSQWEKKTGLKVKTHLDFANKRRQNKNETGVRNLLAKSLETVGCSALVALRLLFLDRWQKMGK